jgi:K+-transporting ATPase ATPase A chain
VSLTDTQAGVLEATAVIGTLVLLHVPLGDYIFRHLATTPSSEDGAAERPGPCKPHWRVERRIYRAVGVDANREQNWAQYLRSVLALSATGILVLYAILRLQAHLPYSEGDPGLNPALAWDTAVSFVTNTSRQNYAGETTTGYTAVIAGLGIEAFASAAVGLAIALALVRGLIRRETWHLGNFRVGLCALMHACDAVAQRGVRCDPRRGRGDRQLELPAPGHARRRKQSAEFRRSRGGPEAGEIAFP